jgi:hypothetical protein
MNAAASKRRSRKVLIDLTGKRVGRLVVLFYAGGNKWVCACDCGARTVVLGAYLRAGRTKSCDCLAKERATKHGRSGSAEYLCWKGMKARCYNPRHSSYENYGGRGIGVADAWRFGENGRHPFECFIAHTGLKPSPAHSIDRIDNDDGYRPGNVRWATSSQQVQNRRPAKRKRRRSSAEEIQAFVDSMKRAASAPGGVRVAP